MAALPIILKILKITGIVLLCLIGLVLLNVILVLFVPVRYKVKFVRTGEEGDDPVNAKGYASWLLHIVHVSLAYPAEAYAIIRVFGIPVARIPQDEEAIRKKAEKQKKKEEAARKKAEGAGDQSAGSEEASAEEGPELDDSSDFFEHSDQETEEGSETSDVDTGTENGESEEITEDEHKSIFSRFKDFLHKIKCTIRDICAKIKKIADDLCDKTKSAEEKLQSIKKDIDYYHKVLSSELFERTYAKCKKRVLRFLRSILPRKGDIRMEVGFDDPYTTGEVLAIAAILQPVTGKFLHVYGNFDESIIRGGGYFKGRIYIYMVVKLILIYLLDRDLKTLIKLFKKEPVKKKGRRTDRRKT